MADDGIAVAAQRTAARAAIERSATTSSKIYRRYSQRKQFATLKSALLPRSLIQNLKPDETFTALNDVSFTVPKGRDARRHRPQRIRQEHAAQARRRHHQADERHGERRRPHLGADRARRRIPPGDLRPRERLHQRHHARPDQARDHRAVRRDRRVRRDEGLHRRAGQDLLVRHVHAPRLRRRDSRRSRRAAGRRSARGRRRGLHAQVPRQVRGVQAPRQDDPARHAFARPGRAVLRRGALARRRPHQGLRAIPSASSAPT